jgi:ribosomal protein S20
MPNIKSQKKRVLTSEKERVRNKAVKANLRTTLKKAEAAIASDADDKGAIVNDSYSAIDVAQRKGVIHKNTANRKKASIAKKAKA